MRVMIGTINRRTTMLRHNAIGQINGQMVKVYDVLQVSDDGGFEWLDFSTIREPEEARIAGRMVVNRGGGVNGHRTADYRIVDEPRVIFHNPKGSLIHAGILFNNSNRLQVWRQDDEEDTVAGWVDTFNIVTGEDAMRALERTARFSQGEDKRQYRIVDGKGRVRFAQSNANSLRLGGILWESGHRMQPSVYDNVAARIINIAESCGDESQIQEILIKEMAAHLDLRDRIETFLNCLGG